MTSRLNRTRHRSLLAVVLAFAFAVAACSASDDESADTTAAHAAAFAPATTAAPTTTSAAGLAPRNGEANSDGSPRAVQAAVLGNGGLGQPVDQRLQIGRDIIFRAELTVAVDDVAGAGAEARTAIEGVGGFLFGQETTGGARPRTVLTFKVQPDRFDEALLRLGNVGEIRSQTVSADDVTERVVDLESRISTAAASVERLRSLLEEVGTVEDIAQLEAELLKRETTLETLRGSLRTLEDAVALATIVVTLTEADVDPRVALELSAYSGGDDGGLSCPADRSLTVEPAMALTLCVEVVNTGDVGLTGFQVDDSVLGLTLGDYTVVFGDPTAIVQPGQSFVLSHETTARRDVRAQTRVSATAVTVDGEPIPARKLTQTGTLFVEAVDPGGLPGFSDGLSASWSALQGMWGLVVVASASAIPFLWLGALAWIYVARRKRRAPTRHAGEREARVSA